MIIHNKSSMSLNQGVIWKFINIIDLKMWAWSGWINGIIK